VIGDRVAELATRAVVICAVVAVAVWLVL